MSKMLIIGNSSAAVSAVQEARRQDPAAEVTLFCPEGVLPYNRYFLPALAARDIRESHVFLQQEKFFRDLNVQLVLNESLARISPKRKQITTESKAHIAYDKLLVTDLPAVKLPPVKGIHKKGVFDALHLTAVRDMLKHLPFTDHVIMPVTDFAGFDMACALNRLGKEVVVLSGGQGLLTKVFDEETASLLRQIVEGKGMRVMADEMEEILGDAEVKAVRLKSGKVMAAEMVVFDEVTPDFKVLTEAGLEIPDAAADQPPLVLHDFGHKICDGFYGGNMRLPEGGREHMKFDGPSNVYKKIFLLNDRLVGAVYFNALGDKDKVRQALEQNLSLAGAEEQFL